MTETSEGAGGRGRRDHLPLLVVEQSAIPALHAYVSVGDLPPSRRPQEETLVPNLCPGCHGDRLSSCDPVVTIAIEQDALDWLLLH